jgi:NAD(P)-dependent dehydrogenase (short-subunit alcohol dehydrogenase family)
MTSTDKASGGVVWVAGVGASAGLGAAVARRFAREGLHAVLTGRTAARLEQVATEIQKAGGQATALPGDVSSEADVLAIAKRVAELGPLESAVFNAATAVWAPSLELSVHDFELALRVNTLGGFIFGREALRALVPRERGSLLFTGATASLRGKPPFAAFAAAKAGLRSLSQSFAREFGPRGVHVAHIVVDGGIDGERVRSRNPQRAEQAGKDGLLDPNAIAEVYWQLHVQPRSTWTQELDLRPYKEVF